jgi:hypothetical protein
MLTLSSDASELMLKNEIILLHSEENDVILKT